jgi:hypothetical protein
MSKNEFDALLLKKLQEEALEYNPKSWQQLSERLDNAVPQAGEMQPFDAMLLNKLQAEAITYNPKSWQQLTERLDGTANNRDDKKPATIPFGKKWGIAIGVAAALCLVMAVAITFNHSNKTVLDNNAPSMVQQPSNRPAVVAPDVVNPRETKLPQTSPPVAAPSLAQQSIGYPANNHVLNSLNPTYSQNANNKPSPNNNTVNQVAEPVKETVVIENKTEHSNIDKEIMAPIKKGAPAESNQMQNWTGQTYAANEPKQKPKTNVSFGGGVNYGNLNTGYAGTMSVKRKIGGDFFVDGTVGMIYNNNANNVAVNNGPSIGGNGNVASRPASATSSSNMSSPALDPIQRLYYVQFNPSFGYQVEDKIALSVGGDFQRMLNQNEEIVQPENLDTKVFPNFDVGLTTKTEFTISPNLQAGLVYREGLNNLIKSDAGRYVNRRYLQVQFKYNIPLKAAPVAD